MVVPVKTTGSVSFQGEKIHLDSALLFQKLIAVYCLEELSTSFGYKLSTRPMPLFDKDDLMNEADKPKLKHALSKLLPEIMHVIPHNKKHVIDGGSLLHKAPWNVVSRYVKHM